MVANSFDLSSLSFTCILLRVNILGIQKIRNRLVSLPADQTVVEINYYGAMAAATTGYSKYSSEMASEEPVRKY